MGDRPPPGAVSPADDGMPGSFSAQLGFGGSGDGNLPRSLAAWFLVVVASLTVPLAVLVWWVVGIVDNEGQYTRALTPLATDPVVQTYVADQVTDALLSAAARSGVTDRVPLATLRPVVESQVMSQVDAPSFAAAWSATLAAAHRTIDTALRGDAAPGSRVTLDLTPVADTALASLHDQGDTAFDQVVADVGRPRVVVQLVPESRLSTVRSVYAALRTARWVLPVVALAAIVGAVALAPARRRVLIGLAVGCAAVSGLTFLALSWGRSAILHDVHSGSSGRQAAAAAYDALVQYLRFDLVVVLLAAAVLLVAVVVSLVVAPRGRSRPRRPGSSAPPPGVAN
jgi:hypothetical protein